MHQCAGDATGASAICDRRHAALYLPRPSDHNPLMAGTVTRQDLEGRIGAELGVSDWFLVDQARVSQFADVTLDHQFLHVDPERAKATPFGGTIAHGLLTLSLIVPLCLDFIPKLDRTKL